MPKHSFLITALEPSANLHLKEVLKAYQAEFGEFELCGIYDEILCKEFGFVNKPLYSSHEFSAMGFVEVLPLIFKAKRAIKELTQLALERQNANLRENLSANLSQNAKANLNQQFLSENSLVDCHADFQSARNDGEKCVNLHANSNQIQKQSSSKSFDAILCIDSPAFNIPFAKALNEAGVKAKKIYYILPQVWAWKKGRIPIIEANFDELASILPFDAQFFRKSTFVGHPLLDEIKDFKNAEQMQSIVEKEEHKKIISFLPGSRRSEITRLMPIFRELATNFKGEKILCVPPFNIARLDELYGDTSAFKVVTNTPQALKKSDFAFICSGTATLEAALIGTPFILAYKARAIDVLIARLFVRLKYIGLANIMCDFAGRSELNPEFLQGQVSAKNLFEAYRKFKYKPFFDKVSFLKNYLRFGSAKNLAKMLSRSDNAERTDE